jgi:four helix bundle protein
MSDYFRFLEWQVYKDSKSLCNYVIELVRKIPKEYRYEIGSQVIRSSLSVPLNISEGSNKHSDKDFNNFLNIALGSLSETIASCDILKDNKFITHQEFTKVLVLSEAISKQLGGFKKKLRS